MKIFVWTERHHKVRATLPGLVLHLHLYLMHSTGTLIQIDTLILINSYPKTCFLWTLSIVFLLPQVSESILTGDCSFTQVDKMKLY